MKKTVLLLCSFLAFAFHGMAQNDFEQAIVPAPVTGLQYFTTTYPYIMVQSMDTAHAGNWLNSMRYTFVPADVAGYTKDKKTEEWNTNSWGMVEEYKDSIMLDNQNRMSVVIDDVNYNFPGYVSHDKYKYSYSYNAAGKTSIIDVKKASPATSTNFLAYQKLIINYDNNNRRIGDTLYSAQVAKPYFASYVYDNNQQVIREYWIDTDPAADKDTAYIAYHTYSGNHLASSVGYSYDKTIPGYALQSCDSFFYNAQQQISSDIQYSYTSVNGGPFEFGPYSKESYTYSSSSKLTDIITESYADSSWYPSSKLSVMYDGNDMPMLGYTYAYINGTLSTTPYERYFFNEFTGVKEIRSKAGFSLYPNPAHDQICMTHLENGNVQYLISDISGKMISEATENIKENQLVVHVSGLNKGIYFIHVTDASQSVVSRFVVE